MTAALSGTRIERNTTISSRNDSRDHRADEPRQPAGDAVAEVDERRGLAADVDLRRRCPATAVGDHVVAQPVHELASVASACGDGASGSTWIDGRRRSGLD